MARDHLLRGILHEPDLRVLVAHAQGVALEAARVQECEKGAGAILAQAVVGAALLAAVGKDRQRVTLQLAGRGPMQGLFVDASANGDIRAYVRGQKVRHPDRAPDLRTAIGPDAYASVLRELPSGEFYQASVAVDDARLDRVLEHYFDTSEQIPTAVSIDVEEDESGAIVRAVGMLVQRLPGGDTEAIGTIRERLRHTPLADEAGARLALEPLQGFGDLEVLEDVPLQLRCSCSRERAVRGVMAAGRDEILDMVVRDRGAELSCEFCKTKYRFEPEELLGLVDELEKGDS